ncbi:MAG: type II toxin-antitoxin system VapC family toxin [Acidobacteriota bacterium]
MRYLLDSNILRHYHDRHPTVLNNFAKVDRDETAIPFIVVAEQMRGRYDGILKARPEDILTAQNRLIETEQMLSQFKVAYLDEVRVERMHQLLSRVKTKKRYADVIIAAIALANNCVVVTRNTDDFKDLVPVQRLQNWVDHVY